MNQRSNAMAQNRMSVYNDQKEKALTREETRAQNNYLSPAVDIYETEDGLVVMADLPGVDKDGLEISVEKGILTLEAHVSAEVVGDEINREFALRNFYRQFRLPDSIDGSASNAVLKNGVLTLNLPRAAAAKPRRIEVTTH
jgi:HSP20 family molecular chaperone IbpA